MEDHSDTKAPALEELELRRALASTPETMVVGLVGNKHFDP